MVQYVTFLVKKQNVSVLQYRYESGIGTTKTYAGKATPAGTLFI